MESSLPPPDPTNNPETQSKKKQHRWFLGIQVALLIIFFLALLDSGTYGWTLFLIIPFCIGLSCGYYSKTFRSRAFLKGTFLVLIILAGISALLLGAGIEGSICILMAEGMLALPALLGMIAGYFIRNAYRAYVIGLIVMLNTSFTVFDSEDTTQIESIATETLTINASREKVWHVLTQPVNFSLHENMFFKAGVTYPTSMQLTYTREGKCFLICNLNNGLASLEIEELDSLNRLRFRIPDDVQTMKELTPYKSLNAAHLKGYFHASYGEFTLEASDENKCTITAKTAYRYKITPAFYWRWWSDYLVNTMHRHVLEDIKIEAEKN
jgi:hypothetical protein